MLILFNKILNKALMEIAVKRYYVGIYKTKELQISRCLIFLELSFYLQCQLHVSQVVLELRRPVS